MSKKQLILNTVSGLAMDFLVYDRKDDEELGRGDIEEAFLLGEMDLEQILQAFSDKICERLEVPQLKVSVSN